MKVADWWSTEDVGEVAPELNEDERKAVLILACHRKHNAELGVNWDVLREWAAYIQEHPEEVAPLLKNFSHVLVEG